MSYRDLYKSEMVYTDVKIHDKWSKRLPKREI